jgi:hypothetical protein
MQDTEFRVGRMVERKGGQLVQCCLFKCGWNLDGNCYSKELHIGQVSGIAVPVCMSYVGILLEED